MRLHLATSHLKLLSVVILGQILCAAARSVTRLRPEERDPMMALPSGPEPRLGPQYVTYQQVAAESAEPRPEAMAEYQAAAAPVAEPQHAALYQGQAEQQQQQQQQYELVQVQAGQEEAAAAHTHDGLACNQRHEPSGEYAGQLIYVGQNRNDADNLKGLVSSWSQASDLSATILSEIPVRDMPEEVLRKLKRDYGVKVVATRERPGANLVINCEEYSSPDSMICNRNAAAREASASAYQPQPVAHGQVVAGEAMLMAPRPVHTFEHVERVLQPVVEAEHVYVTEGAQEQPAEDPRAAEEAGDAQPQSKEARAPEQTSAAASYEGQGGGEEMGGPGPAAHEEAGETGDANEDQHQRGAGEQQEWPQGGHEQRAAPHPTAEWAAPAEDDAKQVQSTEAYPSGRQTTR